MMRYLFFIMIILLGSVWLGTLFAKDSGIVFIIWHQNSLQMSLVVAIIFFLLLVCLIWKLARLFLRMRLFFQNRKNLLADKKQQDFLEKWEEKKACDTLLAAMHAARHLPELNATWHQLPRQLRKSPTIKACYFECLAHYSDQAETIFSLLKKELNKKIEPILLSQWVKFKISTPEKKLNFVEKWLKKQPSNPHLLLAAGQLCLQCQLWGKARSYLNTSLSMTSSSEVLMALGQLAEKMGDTQIAMQRYREGLQAMNQPPFRTQVSG